MRSSMTRCWLMYVFPSLKIARFLPIALSQFDSMGPTETYESDSEDDDESKNVAKNPHVSCGGSECLAEP